MHDVILSLGTNLGDRQVYMSRMEQEVAAILHPPLAMSTLLETEPLGGSADDPWYYNRLVRGRFEGAPHQLLDLCLAIELRLDRIRPAKNAPRTADIDIVLFGEVLLNDARLTLPHARLSDRRFWLDGLLELCPEWRVPGSGKTVKELADGMSVAVRRQRIRPVAPERTEQHGTT